jgi:hypothetical protein
MPVIPATLELEIRRIEVQVQSDQKVSKNLCHQKKLDVVAHACHVRYMGGISRGIAV